MMKIESLEQTRFLNPVSDSFSVFKRLNFTWISWLLRLFFVQTPAESYTK